MKNANLSRLGGFTLIELLVVVLIIGILAAMALPNYQRATELSRVGAALAFSRSVRDAVDRYYMAHGRFPATLDVLDIGVKNCPKYFYCQFTYLASDGKFELFRRNGPFDYAITSRSAVSPAWPNTIYCAAQTDNPKGVEFCQQWGDASPSGDGWVRVLIQ